MDSLLCPTGVWKLHLQGVSVLLQFLVDLGDGDGWRRLLDAVGA